MARPVANEDFAPLPVGLSQIALAVERRRRIEPARFQQGHGRNGLEQRAGRQGHLHCAMKERAGRVGKQRLAARRIAAGHHRRIEPRGAGRGEDLAVADIDHQHRAPRRLLPLGLEGHSRHRAIEEFLGRPLQARVDGEGHVMPRGRLCFVECAKHVRRQIARRIAAAGEVDDPRAGVALGVLLDLGDGRGGKVFRDDVPGQLFGHGDRVGHGVAGRLEDLPENSPKAIGPRRIVARRGRMGRFKLPPTGVGRDPLDAVLDPPQAALPLGKLHSAQGCQAAMRFLPIVPQFLDFLGQFGRIATIVFRQPLAGELLQPCPARRFFQPAVFDRQGRHFPVAGQHGAVAGQDFAPRRRERRFAAIGAQAVLAERRALAPFQLCRAAPGEHQEQAEDAYAAAEAAAGIDHPRRRSIRKAQLLPVGRHHST